MVLFKNTAYVVLVFLCASWLSTARLNPTGAAVNDIPDIKESIATYIPKSGPTVKSLAAIDEGMVKFAPSVEAKKRSVRSRYDELNGDPFAFTADYHRPVHHPPKNN
ncbi:hypothetical protein VNO78_09415 [Psophocarpus tetragonolobus]|uniref:Uncharacterized protein n=1 Tax=Psophocarpus tetragonolobus TaxID=3891 RepID=A0AAN9SZ69_PSOTE